MRQHELDLDQEIETLKAELVTKVERIQQLEMDVAQGRDRSESTGAEVTAGCKQVADGIVGGAASGRASKSTVGARRGSRRSRQPEGSSYFKGNPNP